MSDKLHFILFTRYEYENISWEHNKAGMKNVLKKIFNIVRMVRVD